MTHPYLVLAIAAAALTLNPVHAAPEGSFTVTDAELERLGVRLGTADAVERVEIVAAPAEVVVPPARQALVSAPVGGVVARLFVAEGDSVTEAQNVAEIDSTEFLDRQREYLEAVAAAALTGAQEARDRAMLEEGIIAERRVNESAAAAAGAKAQLEQARAQLALAGFTNVDLTRLASQRELRSRLTLRAPLAGTVTAALRDIGGRVDALDPVFAVADLSELWLEIRVPQESASRVSPGMTASVTVPGGAEVTGPVTAVGGVVDSDTQTVLVRATVPNTGGALRAGQFLTSRIGTIPPSGGALAVPTAAVTRTGSQTLLFVRRGTNVEVQAVEVLADDGARVYVSSGIDASENVALDGVSALKALWLAGDEEGG